MTALTTLKVCCLTAVMQLGLYIRTNVRGKVRHEVVKCLVTVLAADIEDNTVKIGDRKLKKAKATELLKGETACTHPSDCINSSRIACQGPVG